MLTPIVRAPWALARRHVVPCILVVLAAASARAQTANLTSSAAAAGVPGPGDSTGFRADLGLVNTSGNTQVTTVNFSDALTVQTSPANKVGQGFAVVYGTLSRRVQTSLWVAGLRDTYTLNPTIGLFAVVNFDRNTFAGIDRRFEEGGGVSIAAYNAPRDHVQVDLGVSVFEQHSTMGVERNFPAGHTAVDYKHTFGKNEYFEEILDATPDLTRASDYHINSSTSLVAPLSRKIGIKVSYEILYANEPPPGFKTTDRLLTTDIQLTL